MDPTTAGFAAVMGGLDDGETFLLEQGKGLFIVRGGRGRNMAGGCLFQMRDFALNPERCFALALAAGEIRDRDRASVDAISQNPFQSGANLPVEQTRLSGAGIINPVAGCIVDLESYVLDQPDCRETKVFLRRPGYYRNRLGSSLGLGNRSDRNEKNRQEQQ
jgi:hypothetical protein